MCYTVPVYYTMCNTVPVKIGEPGVARGDQPRAERHILHIYYFIWHTLTCSIKMCNLYTLDKFDMKILTNCVEQVFTAWGRPWLCKIVFYSVKPFELLLNYMYQVDTINTKLIQKCRASVYCPGPPLITYSGNLGFGLPPGWPLAGRGDTVYTQ